MSVACKECGQVGAFVSLIVYGYNGGKVENYPNFYIHDRHLLGVEEDEEGTSSYWLVVRGTEQVLWDSPNTEEIVQTFRIKEEWVKENCPNTYRAMERARWNFYQWNWKV